jgi:hypothetical protein
MIRSIFSVLAGFFVIALLTGLTVNALGYFYPGSMGDKQTLPNDFWAAVNLVYSLIFTAIGGFVTGIVARRAELIHSLILGGIFAFLGLLAFLSVTEFQLLWFQISLIFGPLIAAAAGGYLSRWQNKNRYFKWEV